MPNVTHGGWLKARVQLAQAGNVVAEDQVARWLLEWARPRLRKNGEDGEDLAGLFAMRMVADHCRRLAGLRPGAEPDAFLAAALRNVVRNWRRHESPWRERFQCVGDDEEALDRAGESRHAPDPLQLLMDDEAARRIWVAVGRLSEENRQIVQAVVAGVPQAELAARLGLKAGALRERLRSIRDKLRHLLQVGGT